MYIGFYATLVSGCGDEKAFKRCDQLPSKMCVRNDNIQTIDNLSICDVQSINLLSRLRPNLLQKVVIFVDFCELPIVQQEGRGE